MKSKLLFLVLLITFSNLFSQVGFHKKIITDINDGLTITAFSVFAADIDGDGDMDMLSVSRDDGKIAWYENLDGLGNFGSQQIISISGNNPLHMNVSDIDGDDDLDVLTSYSGKIVWFENLDGLGDFGNESIIWTEANANYMSTSDIDGDGDLDVLSSYINKIAWFENIDGLGTFGSQEIITSYSSSSIFFRQVHAGDIDGDGDMDVVTFNDQNVSWFENLDGEGNFILGDDFFISSDGGYLTDIDDDGDVDILVARGGYSVSLYKNNNDNLGTFTYNSISMDGITDIVYAADIDNDGDEDVIGAGNTSITWAENMDGQGNFSTGQFIYIDGVNYGYESIYAADIDNDGDIDLQSASFWRDEIAWYENLGLLGNEINGIVQLDLDSNGCDNDDLPLSNVMINANNDDINFSTFTLTDGNYQLPVNAGEFEVSITSFLPNYYSSNPISQNINFMGLGNVDTINFCIEPNTIINDLNISIYPTNNGPRPGFDTSYQLVYKNIGTTQLNGTVDFEFDDSKLNFLNASETVSSQTGNTLAFDFEDLNPFETRTIDLEFNVFPPPTTEIDDILITTATINPISGDETEDDNVFELEQTVIGSYDPNDITCLEGDQILIDDIDKYLHYLIRFQNTGTADAINVRVEHVLDDKLDWQTMQLETYSHTMRTEIKDGSEVSFIFNNINLPDSTNDEPNSHGFIAFKIKPKPNVEVGDIFNATADIYFDFNPAIVTNTASTEVVESLSIDEVVSDSIKMYPNPTNKLLNFDGNIQMESISIIDINGRLLNSINFNSPKSSHQMDVSGLSNGVYFVRIQSDEGILTKKLIKK